MKHYLIIIGIVYIFSSCNKFESGNKTYNERYGIEKQIVAKDSIKTEKTTKEKQTENDIVYANYVEMIDEYGFERTNKAMLQSCLNNNLTQDEATNYVNYLNNRYFKSRHIRTIKKNNQLTIIFDRNISNSQLRRLQRNNPNYIIRRAYLDKSHHNKSSATITYPDGTVKDWNNDSKEENGNLDNNQ